MPTWAVQRLGRQVRWGGARCRAQAAHGTTSSRAPEQRLKRREEKAKSALARVPTWQRAAPAQRRAR
jgi:hypothetical protein